MLSEKPFNLNILTPEKELFAGQTTFLTAQAVDGEIGILAGHAPLVTLLAPGRISYQLAGGEEIDLDGGAGFLIVKDNQATVLL